MKLNINYESKLIDLFGYTIIGPDNSNRYKIFDNDMYIGYIQYKKIYKKNKNYPNTYAYITQIDSNDIVFNYTRKVYENNLKKTEDNTYAYSFEIKRKDKNDYVDLTIGQYFNIQIWSKIYGYMTFSIDCNGLHLNYKSQTDNYNIEEVVIYRNIDSCGAYTYQISYSKKNNLPNKKITREISGYSIYDNKLRIIENKCVNDKLVNNQKSDVLGNINDMVIKHQMGIDSFNHFRYLINKILPFKIDIIESVINKEMIEQYQIDMFINKQKIIKK